jgi:hypothetical protein
VSEDAKREDDPPEGIHPEGDSPESDEQSLRGSVELPRVVLGTEDSGHQAPPKRVLPGLVDVRWLSYPAYIACFVGGGIAVNFAIDGQEWAAPPIAVAWMMLFFWEWIYGVAYRYRRGVLKYASLVLVVGLAAALAAFCWDRAEPQLVANAQGFVGGGLVERGQVDSLDWAAIFAIASGALIAVHAVILGRGWRQIGASPKDRPYRDGKQRDTKSP